MKKINPSELLIGAHTSTQGGLHNALLEGRSIGATTVQIFTSNQRQWKGRVLDDESIDLFKRTREETKIEKIMSHSSYLINLGSPDPEGLKKSREAFRQEVERCLDLDLTFLNFHPGSATDGDRSKSLDTIVESLLLMEDLIVDDSLRFLLETTAGQGSSIGCLFDELSYILERVKRKIPIGVCIDTCHIFAAGYDIRTKEKWQETLETFDRIIGLNHLFAFHLNDSLCPFNSRKDRHASLGEGEIGMECFKFLMQNPFTHEIPKYLETPEGPPVWEKEIWKLREFAKCH